MIKKQLLPLIFLLSLSSISSIEKETLSPPIFSKNSGFYPDEFLLTLSSENNNIKILYTIDATDPLDSETSQQYTEPILIKDRSNEPNIYAEYGEEENNPQSISNRAFYHKPKYKIDKAMVVRAVAVSDEMKSKVVSNIYFVTNGVLNNYRNLTVISLITNPKNLFDPDIGIYVVGNQFIAWKNSPEYDPNKNQYDLDNKCNFFGTGKEWERESFFTFFEKEQIILEREFGLRLKGSSTRNNPGKSFELIPRNEKGEKEILIDEKLLPKNFNENGELINSYYSIHLRSIYEETRLRDKFASEILFNNKRKIITLNNRDAVLFLNGEYWGFYTITEKIDNKYFENHFNIPVNNVVVMKENIIKEGPNDEQEKYTNFINKYSKLDLTDEKNYNEILNFMDIDSFIEIYVIGIYIGMIDWPTQNHGAFKYIGNKIENNIYTDGKWRYFIYDFDYTMGIGWQSGIVKNYAYDHFTYLNRRENDLPTNLFKNLLNNKNFVEKFVNMYCDYAYEVMKISQIKKLAEKYENEETELIAYSQLRWWGADTKNEGYLNYKNNYLYKVLPEIITYFTQRPYYSLEHMQDYFKLQGKFHTLNLLVKGEGKIKINSIIPTLTDGKWKGRYLSGVPVNITAIPFENKIFKKWVGGNILSENKVNDLYSIVVDVNEPMEIEVVFEDV